MAISSHSSQTARIVGGGFSISPIPAISIKQCVTFLKNAGGSVNQNVNGSVTPVDFYCGPAAGQIGYVEHLTFGIDDGGGCPPSSYAAIASGLTNGVQVILKKGGVEYEIVNLKNNGDIALSFNFPVGFFENGKFLAMANGFIGKLVFATNITLYGDDGDIFIFRVRDDLTGLIFQRAAMQGWQELV